ncbi:hypothetical protein HBB16_07485 [Pseudonocardia sp. MCCB 268]|nr:hypothetical protein [Pseudonocardia cytotoxica]
MYAGQVVESGPTPAGLRRAADALRRRCSTRSVARRTLARTAARDREGAPPDLAELGPNAASSRGCARATPTCTPPRRPEPAEHVPGRSWACWNPHHREGGAMTTVEAADPAVPAGVRDLTQRFAVKGREARRCEPSTACRSTSVRAETLGLVRKRMRQVDDGTRAILQAPRPQLRRGDLRRGTAR